MSEESGPVGRAGMSPYNASNTLLNQYANSPGHLGAPSVHRPAPPVGIPVASRQWDALLAPTVLSGGSGPFANGIARSVKPIIPRNESHLQSGNASDDQEVKVNNTRTKNREAQQRFRDRQRARRRDAEDLYADMEAQREQLIKSNEELMVQNVVMEKTLGVRDAMISAFLVAHPTTASGQQPKEEAVLQGVRGLARAIGDLPRSSDRDLEMSEAAAAALPCSDERQRIPGSSVENEILEDERLPELKNHVTQFPSNLLKGGPAPGAIDGTPLQKIPSVPPPSDPQVGAAIEKMTDPDQLVEYWREWTIGLKKAWEAAVQSDFDASSTAAVDLEMGKMSSMWWHAAHLKPAYLLHLVYAALPKDSGQHPRWTSIAAEILHGLDDDDLETLRSAWRQYTRSLAKAAVGVELWIKDLALLNVADELGPMAVTASSSINLAEITARVFAAMQEEYLATMEFIGNQLSVTTMQQKAYINYESLPYMPDVVAIMYHILKLAQIKSGEPSVRITERERLLALENRAGLDAP